MQHSAWRLTLIIHWSKLSHFTEEFHPYLQSLNSPFLNDAEQSKLCQQSPWCAARRRLHRICCTLLPDACACPTTAPSLHSGLVQLACVPVSEWIFKKEWCWFVLQLSCQNSYQLSMLQCYTWRIYTHFLLWSGGLRPTIWQTRQHYGKDRSSTLAPWPHPLPGPRTSQPVIKARKPEYLTWSFGYFSWYSMTLLKTSLIYHKQPNSV